MKVYPIPHAIFETKRSGIIQILQHCLVPWKTTPLYFFSSNIVYFGQKEPFEVECDEMWKLKSDAKFEENLTCSLENDMRNLAHFDQSTWKCQNWDFDEILLSKVENTWAKNLQMSYM